MPNAIDILAPWMQHKEAEEIIDQINLMPRWKRWPKNDVLGQRLGLTNPDRERLKLWGISPCDMGEKGMQWWWRKQKKRERMRRLRQLRGQQSRAEYLASHYNIKRTALDCAWYQSPQLLLPDQANELHKSVPDKAY
jgi:hypothetical protein